ncbi:hypothetical protein VTO42DRAFT_3621 [Malbranchea cinnamomea]
MASAQPQERMSRKSSTEPSSTSANRDPSGSQTPEDTQNAKNGNDMKNWYMRTWPRRPKAPAVTEIARESISASGPICSERNSSTTSFSGSRVVRSPTIGLTRKSASSTRSLPADTTTTRVHIASTRSASVPQMPKVSAKLSTPSKSLHDSESSGEENGPEEAKSQIELETKVIDDDKKEGEKQANQEASNTPIFAGEAQEISQESTQQSSLWSNWFFRPKNSPDAPSKSQTDSTEASAVGQSVESPGPQIESKREQEVLDHQADRGGEVPDKDITAASEAQRRSWLQLLTRSSTAPVETKHAEPPVVAEETQQPIDNEARPAQPQEAEDRRGESSEKVISKPQNAPKPSSGWIFWPLGRQSQNTGGKDGTNSQEKVISETVQTQPATSEVEVVTSQVTQAETVRQQTKNAVAQGLLTTTGHHRLQEPSISSEPAVAKQPSSAESRKTQRAPNQLLPSLKRTFRPQEKPGILQQLNRWLYSNKDSEPKHVSLVHELPRVKKAIAIGVHGYFPAPLLRTVLGQPTGTSVKFSTHAAKAISEWADLCGCPCEIEKIALEGEGHIEERVDLLWKLLINWIEHIRAADFIMVACHSQGVPVATMLVAKLIAFGCVNSAKIGICAMAGVNLGPFPDLRSRWISGSAGELFDFADPKSKVSQDYMAALKTVLDFGVKITYIGSIDDQLVSLESSTFACVSHPHIYRAVFVDGRVHAPSFLSHLVGFAMKLRNLGISDHGLIRELSAPLAGSLYTGEGHSRLYDDDAVYKLAIEFALETTSVSHAVLEVHRPPRLATSNPFILPFAMRGVLEEEYVRRELAEETMALLQQFDDWKPSSKVLKDVKFRLEGIRSKL